MDTQTVEVKVAVPVPCIDSIPPGPPVLSDKQLMSGSGAQVVDKLWIDHLQGKDYTARLVAVLLACIRPVTAAQNLGGSIIPFTLPE
jgi:hypothetical protein